MKNFRSKGDYRFCHGCKKHIPKTEFAVRNKEKGWLQSRCVKCFKDKGNIYARNRTEEGRAQDLVIARKWRASNHGRVMNWLRVCRNSKVGKLLGYDLDYDFLERLLEDSKGLCAVSGMEFDREPRNLGSEPRRPYSPSLDRIDATRGYYKDNVRIVCTCVNFALCDWGEDVFKRMCEAYIAKQKSSL